MGLSNFLILIILAVVKKRRKKQVRELNFKIVWAKEKQYNFKFYNINKYYSLIIFYNKSKVKFKPKILIKKFSQLKIKFHIKIILVLIFKIVPNKNLNLI